MEANPHNKDDFLSIKLSQKKQFSTSVIGASIQNKQSHHQHNLYDHLATLLNQLPKYSHEKIAPFQNLQAISTYLKNNRFKANEPLTEVELQKLIHQNIQYPKWIQQQSSTLQTIHSPSTSLKTIQNFHHQHQALFKKVGISLGEQEAIRIHSALKQIAEKVNAVNLRFWGKILAKNGDYLVIEGLAKKDILPEALADMEKYREGANYNSFWVNHSSVNEEWYELPLVTPGQMRTSRLIKYAFTGDLNKKILSYPAFDGQQKHLLKAQLVRITHNCEIAPKGQFNPVEENPDEIDYAEEFKLPDFSELSNLQNWAHINPNILGQGRATYYVDPKVSEAEKQEMLTKLAETDPKIERLKGINEDKPIQKMGFEGCWLARTYGSTQLFNNIGKQQGTTACYGVVALRNPNWPGWVTVASNKSYGSIYIGLGMKATQPSFFPIGPEDLNVEGEDIEEFGEPNPKEPPDELEPDSDEENKKPEE